MTQVAIIGCGPAGLLAAHATTRAGHEPVIYSLKKQPSPMTGGVYLHIPIPDISDKRPDGLVQFIKVGHGRGYAAKVYGNPETPTSWQRFGEGMRPAWALQPVYEALWRSYGPAVVGALVGPDEAAHLAASYPLVLTSAPAESLCHGGHAFPSVPVWYRDAAPQGLKDNQMMYNGVPDVPWFRASKVFGIPVTEYGHEVRDARLGLKVQATDCTCHPTIKRIGRWGTWQPGQLLHHAYKDAQDAVHEL